MAQTAVVRPSLAPVLRVGLCHSQGHSRHLRFPTSGTDLSGEVCPGWRSVGVPKPTNLFGVWIDPRKNKRFFFRNPPTIFGGVPIWQKIHVSHLLFSWNLEGNEPCYLLAYEATQSKTNFFLGITFDKPNPHHSDFAGWLSFVGRLPAQTRI